MILRYQCYLFDLDNTLVDTDDIKRRALSELGVKHAATIPDTNIRTMAPTKFLKRVGQDLGSYWKVYQRVIAEMAEPIVEDLISVLDNLDSKGAYLGIITASPMRIAKAVLRSSRLDKYFQDRIWFSRNKVKTIIEALDHIGCAFHESIYIGDREKDYVAARDAGIAFALALWGCLRGDPIIDKVDIRLRQPSDLLRLR